MSFGFRRLVRGDVDTGEVEDCLRDRYGFDEIEIEPVDGDNWLSVPLVVNDLYFVKVITPQNAFAHSIFTGTRNLGTWLSGGETLFETYDSPMEMARHEFRAAKSMGEAGVPSPEPVEVLPAGDNALLVVEYLPDFEALSTAEPTWDALQDLFRYLQVLHGEGLAHGDMSPENVLLVDGDVHFIDATRVREGMEVDGVAYDLACALGTVSSVVDEETAVEAASTEYGSREFQRALDFLVFARLRPGIGQRFSVRKLRNNIRSKVLS